MSPMWRKRPSHGTGPRFQDGQNRDLYPVQKHRLAASAEIYCLRGLTMTEIQLTFENYGTSKPKKCPHCGQLVERFIDHIPKEHDPIRQRGKWVYSDNEIPTISQKDLDNIVY